MVNPDVTQARFPLFPNRSQVYRPDQYRGGNTTRQGRFDLRSQRRWGNWGILECPTPLLWFEDVFEIAEAEEAGFLPTPIIDLWL